MKNAIAAVVVIGFSFAAHDSVAQAPGDLVEGLATARQVCAECHAIEKEQMTSPNSKSPTFLKLANTPGMTSIALSAALTTPHAGMPMFVLSADQRANIIAYILSLKE